MRIALRIALVGIVLVGVGLGALAVALPRIVKSDAVRTRIEAAAEQALGRKLRYGELDFGLLPPSLLVREPSVAGAAEGDPPLVRAEEIALRVALMPLLARSVVVDSLVIEGAALRLVRTAKGLELPTLGPREPAPEAPAEPGAPVALALRGFTLRDATLVLEDRAVKPAVTWELREIDARASGESLEQPIAFELSAALASGGRIRAEGSATLDGDLDARLTLDALAVAALRPYLDGPSELAGSLSGRVTARGPAASPESVVAELSLDDTRVAVQDAGLVGGVSAKIELAGDLAKPNGRFEVDATRTEIRYGETFHKPAGRAATLRGRLVTRQDGTLGVEEAALQLHNLKADASVQLGKRTRVTARVPPFDIGGWQEMVPALAAYSPSGPVEIGELRIATTPLEVNGRVVLDGLRATHPEAGAVTLRGAIVARGDAIETREFALVAADQTVLIDARVDDLAGTPRYRVRSRTEKADTNALVSAFTARRDTFFGVLDFDGELSGTAGDEPLRSLRGTTQLDIRDGRIVGLSMLQAVLSALGDAGRSAQGLATLAVNYAALTNPDLQRYYKEDFEALTGTFHFADGMASTKNLRLDYRDYSVTLDGQVGLVDSGYDLGCVLRLGPEISAFLARKLGGSSPESFENLTIPARLRGQLDRPFETGRNPGVVVPPEAAVAFFRAVALDQHRSKATRAIDDALGQGTGEQVLDVLDGILGGERRR